ncbi:MAG: AMP-binding protein [Selenomonadaceae bacterium]|nr:AMP-binding protein [Selenomonadaceae bacterium]
MLVHEIINNGQSEAIAIVDEGRQITYAALKQGIKKYRNRLYELGIRTGDRVGIFSRNSLEFVYAYFATASLGAINVPINFQLSTRETAYILQDAGVEHLLTYEPLTFDEPLNVVQHDIATFGDKIAPDAPELPADFSENNPCVIIYTSGTTGNPKGAVLSHKNLVCNTRQCEVFKCHSKCKVLCVLPMYHCFGWTCVVLNTFYRGAELDVMRVFKPKDMVDMVRDLEITDIIIVPSIFKLVTALAKPEDFKSVRFFMSGGTTLPDKIVDEFNKKFNRKIAEGYGLSEASPAVFLTTHGEERQGSCGKLLAGTEVRLVDEEGNDVAQGEVGEVLVRGGQVMLGYWNNPKATAETLDKDGWLHTGDVGKVDADGYYYIVSRIKEMIISMGENIYPREVEEVVYKFAGIKDAAVIGVDDKLRGQVGACFFDVQDGATVDIRELKKFLQKNLALYKVPREFKQIAEMPRTSTGKIAKRKILEDYLAAKGL